MGYKTLNLPQAESEEFPEGLILISGRNSHGKSTIIEGILFALFFGIKKGEQIFKGRTAESLITYGQSKAEILIYFELDNTNYYINRRWGKSGPVPLKLFEQDKKSGIYREIKDIDIEEFFEISKDQAMSTIFIKQGEVEKLSGMSGADLRDMIIDLFRLGIIDDALNFLEKDKKSKEAEQSIMKREQVPIDRINEDIARLKLQNDLYQKAVLEKEKRKKDVEKALKSYPSQDIVSEIESLYKEKEIRDKKSLSFKSDFEKKIKTTELNLEDFSSMDMILERINTLNKKKIEMEKLRENLDKDKEAKIKGKGITEGRIKDTENKIAKIQKSIKFTEKRGDVEIALCPTCQSELTKDHYNKIIQEFRKDLEINNLKLEQISILIRKQAESVNSCQKELDTLIKSITINQNLKDDFENFQRYDKESKQIREKLETFLSKNKINLKEPSLEGIQKIASELEKNLFETNTLLKDINEKNDQIIDNQNRIRELEIEIERMKELEKKINELDIDLEHINKTKEYVRRFVTEYMVTKRLVKDITSKTDKYIRDFTSGQYSDLLIDTASTKKTGIALRIKDNFNGQSEPIEVLSGGDRTALGMALRLAISELMGHIRPTKDSPKRNPKINFLMLDEPLAALDEVRRERILKHLIKSKSFSQIFLITHTDIPYDILTHKILVEKDINTGISSANFQRLN